MIDRVFLDSNLLVYIYDSSEPEKRRVATRIIKEEILADRAVVSSQVLQEFYVGVTRKLEPPLDYADACAAVEALAGLRIALPRAEMVLAAIRRSHEDTISFWDALIVEAALSAECARLLSEDFQDGRRFGELVVLNPFK
jgi:predicted nucleic acid-binding protein